MQGCWCYPIGIQWFSLHLQVVFCFLSNFSQIQCFAGVGAHHHNGVAEKAIQTIMSIARTMMLHSAIHGPEVSDPSLWPMAVQYAAYLYNKVPDPCKGLCPDDLFTKT